MTSVSEFIEEQKKILKEEKSAYDNLSNKELKELLKEKGFTKTIPRNRDLKIKILEQIDEDQFCNTNSKYEDGICNVSNIKKPGKPSLGDLGVIMPDDDDLMNYEFQKGKNVEVYQDKEKGINILASKRKIDQFKKYYNKKFPVEIKPGKKKDEKTEIDDLIDSLEEIDFIQNKEKSILPVLETAEDEIIDYPKFRSLENLLKDDEDKDVAGDELNLDLIMSDSSPAGDILKDLELEIGDYEISKSKTEELNAIDLLAELDDLLSSKDTIKNELKAIEKIVKNEEELNNKDVEDKTEGTVYIKKSLLPDDVSTSKQDDILKLAKDVLSFDKDDLKYDETIVEVLDPKPNNDNVIEITEEGLEKIGLLSNLTKTQKDVLNRLCKDKKGMKTVAMKTLDDFIKSLGIPLNSVPRSKPKKIELICAINDNNVVNPQKFGTKQKGFDLFAANYEFGVFIPKKKSWSKFKNVDKIVIKDQLIFGPNDVIQHLREKNMEEYREPTKKDMSPVKKENFMDIIQKEGLFTFAFLATNIDKVKKLLTSKGNFTLFIPSQAAFEKLPEGKITELVSNKKELGELLSYHVVKNSVSIDRLNTLSTDEKELNTLLTNRTITITRTGEKISLNGRSLIVEGKSNIETSNGIIHIIDEILTPLDKKLEKSLAIEEEVLVLEKIEEEMDKDEEKLALALELNVKTKNITAESGVKYTKNELKMMDIKSLKQILKTVFGKTGNPTKKENVIEYILAVQEGKTCNLETSCEEDGYACDVSNIINDDDFGICVKDIEIKGKHCANIGDKKYFGTKKILAKILEKHNPELFNRKTKEGKKNIKKKIDTCELGRSILEVIPGSLISMLNVDEEPILRTPLKVMEDLFGTSNITEITKEKLDEIDSRRKSITKTGLVDFEEEGASESKEDKDINRLKNPSDLERMFTMVNAYDYNPETINEKTKEQIFRCLGLVS